MFRRLIASNVYNEITVFARPEVARVIRSLICVYIGFVNWLKNWVLLSECLRCLARHMIINTTYMLNY